MKTKLFFLLAFFVATWTFAQRPNVEAFAGLGIKSYYNRMNIRLVDRNFNTYFLLEDSSLRTYNLLQGNPLTQINSGDENVIVMSLDSNMQFRWIVKIKGSMKYLDFLVKPDGSEVYLSTLAKYPLTYFQNGSSGLSLNNDSNVLEVVKINGSTGALISNFSAAPFSKKFMPWIGNIVDAYCDFGFLQDGSCVLIGMDSVDYDNTSANTRIGSFNSPVLVKYNSNGVRQVIRNIDEIGWPGSTIKGMPNGNFYLTKNGGSIDTIIGPGVGMSYANTTVLKFSSNGYLLNWYQSTKYLDKFIFESNGNMYLSFYDTLSTTLWGTQHMPLTAPGNTSSLYKVDSTFNVLWKRDMPTNYYGNLNRGYLNAYEELIFGVSAYSTINLGTLSSPVIFRVISGVPLSTSFSLDRSGNYINNWNWNLFTYAYLRNKIYAFGALGYPSLTDSLYKINLNGCNNFWGNIKIFRTCLGDSIGVSIPSNLSAATATLNGVNIPINTPVSLMHGWNKVIVSNGLGCVEVDSFWTYRGPNILDSVDFVTYRRRFSANGKEYAIFYIDDLYKTICQQYNVPLTLNLDTGYRNVEWNSNWGYVATPYIRTHTINIGRNYSDVLFYRYDLVAPVNTPYPRTFKTVASPFHRLDANHSNDTTEYYDTTAAPYDPNEKVSSKNGHIRFNRQYSTQTIEYTVHFQNTGSAPASFVQILDSLPEGVDVNTFKYLGSSHSCTIRKGPNGSLIFTYDNIYLPDSGRNFAGSMGFVKYSIKTTNQAFVAGKILKSNAKIIFDQNSPIVTNLTSDTVVIDNSSVGIRPLQANEIRLYPNPATDQVMLQWDVAGGADYAVYSMTGQLVQKGKAESGVPISTTNLANGAYQFVLKVNNQSIVKKLLIAR